jgi:hypothetical protein
MLKEWTRGDLLSVSSAYWRGCALQAGVRLAVFTTINGGLCAAAEVAEAVGADSRATGLLLDALAAMGLLRKEQGHYRNTATAEEFLVAGAPGYMGHIILHHHHILDGWAQLDQAVRQGGPVQRRSYGAEIERESFLMGMFNLAMGVAPILAGHLPLAGRRRLLDLGGGPGTYAIHFCLANPDLQAVIYDRPTTEPFARATVEKFGLTGRIDFLPGDFTCDPVGGGPYDAAWLSHVLHSNSLEQCQALIDKTAAVLAAGGQIMIHDFILDNAKDSPEFAALFSLNMLLGNGRGRSYSEEEIAGMLERAGITRIERLAFRGPNDSSVMVGVK